LSSGCDQVTEQRFGQPYQCIGGSMYHCDPQPNDGTTLFVLAEDFEIQSREIERLTAGLKTANANHERFEREWYLRGDVIEHLRTSLEGLHFHHKMFEPLCRHCAAALGSLLSQ
jgi:hypothetical protein